jgi:tRNA(Ile)-lysidine synthase
MSLITRVAAYIEEHELLIEGQQVVVGVSGGADSLCLLDLLCKLGYEPIVAHLDHKLRPRSAADAEYVTQVAKDRGFEVRVDRDDPRRLSEDGYSLEEAARMVRYQFLIRIAIESGVESVAVGHTADDQAETVLMNLIRGTGSVGLGGMKPIRNMGFWTETPGSNRISLVRPLLDVERRETNKYCEKHGLEVREDPTNLDNSFIRNRIRNKLLPVLEEYNQEIRKTLLRTSKIMTRVTDLTKTLVEKAKQSIVIENSDEYELFDLELFEQQHEGLKWDLIYQSILHLSSNKRDVDYEAVSRATHLFSSEKDSRVELVGGTEAYRFHKLGLIRRINSRVKFKNFPQMGNTEPIQVELGKDIELNDHWYLTSSLISNPAVELELVLRNDDAYVGYFSVDELSTPLLIRPMSPGDRFLPFGMDGSVKVSDFFTNNKIPTLAREYWPLLCEENEILWIMGLRQSNCCQVGEHTHEIAKFRLVPLREEYETKV